ncbi:hypothetical protein [uncultured Shimia sp.]|uniref:hypothetical protein n=1 Tax=uncultured Shimia sp. TaxID=573152 RepID=UPI00261A244D|nr:hypothetical protein [uncultured Shimia sp.]
MTIIFVNLSAPTHAETVLLMMEEEGCLWCARWNEEIAPIYPKTAEGQIAPLQRHDIHDPLPNVALARSVVFTPTFILLVNGIEKDRIEGYPGEDFFWGLVSEMLKRSSIEPDTSGS